jgi:hypothetical protein
MAVTAAVSNADEPAFFTTLETPVPPLLWFLAISDATTQQFLALLQITL